MIKEQTQIESFQAFFDATGWAADHGMASKEQRIHLRYTDYPAVFCVFQEHCHEIFLRVLFGSCHNHGTYSVAVGEPILLFPVLSLLAPLRYYIVTIADVFSMSSPGRPRQKPHAKKERG